MPYTLTDTTVDILKNFANINSQAVFKAGTAQRTCNTMRNFIADVELPESLPVDCSLYELNRLLGILDTCKGTAWPTIEFGAASLVVDHDHGQVTIPYAHAAVVAAPPTQTFFLSNPIASFTLTNALWTKIKRTAAVLQTTDVYVVVTAAGDLSLKLVNAKDKGGDTGGSASYNLPDTVVTDPVDNIWSIKFDALELLPGDYKVDVGEVGTSAHNNTLFGMFFTLIDPVKKVTYLTSGSVVKAR